MGEKGGTTEGRSNVLKQTESVFMEGRVDDAVNPEEDTRGDKNRTDHYP